MTWKVLGAMVAVFGGGVAFYAWEKQSVLSRAKAHWGATSMNSGHCAKYAVLNPGTGTTTFGNAVTLVMSHVESVTVSTAAAYSAENRSETLETYLGGGRRGRTDRRF